MEMLRESNNDQKYLRLLGYILGLIEVDVMFFMKFMDKTSPKFQ